MNGPVSMDRQLARGVLGTSFLMVVVLSVMLSSGARLDSVPVVVLVATTTLSVVVAGAALLSE